MSLHATYGDAWRAACDALAEARGAGRRGVLLARDAQSVNAAKRALAAEGAGFGVQVDTPAGFAAGAWSLLGDGRALIGPWDRVALLARVLADAEAGGGAAAGGAAAGDAGAAGAGAGGAGGSAGGAAEAGAGDPSGAASFPVPPAFVAQVLQAAGTQAARSDDGLLGAEVQVARTVRAYAQAAHAAGLVEPCDAYRVLAGHAEQLQPWALVAFDLQDAPLPVPLDGLLHAAGCLHVDCSQERPEGTRAAELDQLLRLLYRRGAEDAPVPARGALQLAFAAGPTAQLELLSREALRLANDGDVAVAAPDPMLLFRHMRPALAEAGLDARVTARLAFEDTDLGRALLALASLVPTAPAAQAAPAAPEDTLAAADFALNPFAGMWYGTAFFADKLHRGNRLADVDDLLTDLAGHAAPELQGVIGLLEAGDAGAALDVLAAYLHARFGGDEAYVAEQSSALAACRNALEAAGRWGVAWQQAMESLRGRTVRVDLQTDDSPTTGAAFPAVRLMTLADAARLQPASVHAVLVGALDADSYPVRHAEDALARLLGKWGQQPARDPLAVMRHTFFRAASAARDVLVLQRCLRDERAEDLQPALVLEEVLGCYRNRMTSQDGIDRETGAPDELARAARALGEQHLVRNATGRPTPATRPLPAPSAGSVSPDASGLVVLPRLYCTQRSGGLDVSASQIESYLECPYQWFAKRRLKLEALDEGFGPLERGTFMHRVLQDFYERLAADVGPRVTLETLPAAAALLARVFAEAADAQPQERPGSRYAPRDAWERTVQEGMLPRLQAWLASFEAGFLPGFAPWKLEWGYGEAVPYSYAGCNLCGRVDRIDLDGQGRAVVVDYKSSLGDAYRLHGAGEGAGATPASGSAQGVGRRHGDSVCAAHAAPKGSLAHTESPACAQPLGGGQGEAADAGPFGSNPVGREVIAEGEPLGDEREGRVSLQLPRKLQALIYAKAVRDELGVPVVGAVYVNPLARPGQPTVLGAYDSRVLGASDLGFRTRADAQACAVPLPGAASFDELLDACEALAAERMAGLAQGDVRPQPSGEEACRYCPVGNCNERLTPRRL